MTSITTAQRKIVMIRFNNCLQTKFNLWDWNRICLRRSFHRDKHLFDFNKYPVDSRYHDPAKKMIGKMKDETKGIIIDDPVELKSKMHSLAMVDNGKS